MKSIRLLDDETRFYIVIDNPTEEDKANAIAFVSSLCGKKEKTPDEPKVEKPQDMDAIKVETPELPTDEQLDETEKIPYIGTVKVFNEWYRKSEKASPKRKAEIIHCCGYYIKKQLKKTDESDSIDEKKNFIESFQLALEPVIRDTLNAASYGDNLTGFLNNESEDSINALYMKCRNAAKEIFV